MDCHLQKINKVWGFTKNCLTFEKYFALVDIYLSVDLELGEINNDLKQTWGGGGSTIDSSSKSNSHKLQLG